MAALEEFELGIEHIRNAFKRADNGFTNAYKMLEAQQQKNHKLEAENAKLRGLLSMYMTLASAVARGISIQSAYVDGMGRMLNETEMRESAMELGIEWCR